MTNSHKITLDTYKTLTKQEFIKGDENFPSIILNWDDELVYAPKKHVVKEVMVKTTKLKWIKSCFNCWNNRKWTFKSKSLLWVKARVCLQCGFRQ